VVALATVLYWIRPSRGASARARRIT